MGFCNRESCQVERYYCKLNPQTLENAREVHGKQDDGFVLQVASELTPVEMASTALLIIMFRISRDMGI